MASEYTVKVIFTRDLNSDTGMAFSKFPNEEIVDALRNLMEEDLKRYCDDFGGEFAIQTVTIPNSAEEVEKNDQFTKRMSIARALLESNSGTPEERKNAVEVLMEAAAKIGSLPEKITVKVGARTLLMRQDAYKKVLELLKEQKSIEAIKVIREQTGLGLKESKDIIDELKTKEETK